MINVRLYRAMSKNETEKGIISKEINNLSMADEIYSHVVSSYQLRQGPLYSFTDKLSVARRYVRIRPDKYTSIGYIDVMYNEETGEYILPKEMKFLFRISQAEDWLDLIEQENNGKAINNLNYKTFPVKNYSKLFVPSQKGLVSWSSNASEYVAICKGVFLELVDNERYLDPMFPEHNKPINRNRKPFNNYPEYINNLNGLGLKSQARKNYVLNVLEKYREICCC